MGTGDVQNISEKLNEDYLFFLEHFKGPFDGLKSVFDKEICKKWLTKLTIETYGNTAEKLTRNIYLSQLILNMNERKFSPPFNAAPTGDPLSLDGVFQQIMSEPIADVEIEEQINETKDDWSKFVYNRELEMIDLNYLSNDGRTYIASQTLPENSGIFAYLAVTMGGDSSCKWVNACGQSISAPVAKPLDLKVESANGPDRHGEHEGKMYQITKQVRSVLAKRRSPESRTLHYEFYKKLYDSIEQEMLSEDEPNSTACHNPYIEKLLEKLIEDTSKTCANFNPELFKRIKLLSLLKKRVKNILQQIEERNRKITKIEMDATSPLLALTDSSSTCSNAMTEMMWQGALLEKPTSKVAESLAKTYPTCLVKMLIALLARERRKIINQMQEKHEKIVLDMKRGLQNEIQQGIEAYKAARKEWVDVMRIVMHYNRTKTALTVKDIGSSSDNSKGDHLQEKIRKEIDDVRNRLVKGTRKNEMLQNDICELNKNLHEVTEKIEHEQQRAKDLIRYLHNDICNEKSSILLKTQTIDELESMLKELKKQ